MYGVSINEIRRGSFCQYGRYSLPRPGELNIQEHQDFFSFMGYSQKDIEAISELYKYGVPIHKQTEEGYFKLQIDAQKLNDKKCDCDKIIINKRINGWTSYHHSFKNSCNIGPSISPPLYCPNSQGFILSCIFVVLLIIVGIILYKIIKKYKKKR